MGVFTSLATSRMRLSRNPVSSAAERVVSAALRKLGSETRSSAASFGGNLLEAGLAVGESHVELLGAGNDVLALLGGDGAGDLAAVGSVVHEQQFNVFLVLDQKLSETTGEHVSGLSGLLLTNVGHLAPAAEATALGVVDTSGPPPGRADTEPLVGLESVGVVGHLLHDLMLSQGLNCHYLI